MATASGKFSCGEGPGMASSRSSSSSSAQSNGVVPCSGDGSQGHSPQIGGMGSYPAFGTPAIPTHHGTGKPKKSSSTDFSRLSHSELVQRVKKLEADLLKLASDHNHMIREANNRIQSQSLELGNLKSANGRLEENNTELAELCCFLDDDRLKGRKLGREWQRFGRYMSSVMRQEVAAYQSKLKELESRQQQLVHDNMELKELCLYLDEERNQNVCSQCGSAVRRDDGDGSSSSTNPPEEYNRNQNETNCIPNTERSTEASSHTNADAIYHEHISRKDSEIPQDVAEDELKSKGCRNESEEESCSSRGGTALESDSRAQSSTTYSEEMDDKGILSNQIVDYVRKLEKRVSELEKQDTVSCPESVLNALQVLQVCKRLDEHDIKDQEKALVRQMCNVVWKKLEDNPKL